MPQVNFARDAHVAPTAGVSLTRRNPGDFWFGSTRAARACKMIPLFVLPFTLLVVLASSISGDQHFSEMVTMFRQPPYQVW
jgi:hypothetical protein